MCEGRSACRGVVVQQQVVVCDGLGEDCTIELADRIPCRYWRRPTDCIAGGLPSLHPVVQPMPHSASQTYNSMKMITQTTVD